MAKAKGHDDTPLPVEPEAAVPSKGGTKKATVTLGALSSEVEYPADAENADTAAVEAFKALHGLWHLPEPPKVQLDPKKG